MMESTVSIKKDTEKVNKIIICILSLIMVVYILTTKWLFPPEAFIDRSIYLALSFLILFCFQFPKYKGVRKFLLVLGTIFAVSGCLYIIIFSDKIIENWFMATNTDFYALVFYFIGVVLVLQDSFAGKIISVMSIISVMYVFLGYHMSGIFTLPVFTIRQVATMIFTDIDQGAFGIFLATISRVLSIFLMFSSLLVATGLGDFIRAASMMIAGKTRGAPAKVAVIASGLFGMLSGSSVSNVAATGSFTIPLMKSIGYKPSTAATIETIASSGGTLMPPIMGLSAFIMCEILGIPYVRVITFAIIPAFLWYYTAFCIVHFGALTQNVKVWTPPRKELIEVVKGKGHLTISIFVLIFFIVYQKVPELAALYSVTVLLFLSFLRKGTRLNWEKTQSFLIDFAKIFSNLTVLCTMLGIFTGALLSTGTHTKLVSLMFGGIDNWFVAAVITFLLCVVFGMLVPPFAAYVTVVIITAPILRSFGFSIPVAHMFVLYSCVLAPITPPVALAAYTAASIAGADPMQTAKEASIKALPLWLIPFILLKQNIFLGMGTSWIKIIIWTAIIMVGIYICAMATNRYCFGKISWQWTSWLTVLVFMILQPLSPQFSILGCVLGIGSVIILFYLSRKKVTMEETNKIFDVIH